MTSVSHSLYQQFQQLLRQFQRQLTDPVTAHAEVRSHLAQLQQMFQAQIVPLTEVEDEAISTQLQSIQIEINKQLRLLETDAIFLQAARQPTTVQQRKQQMNYRLETLLQYCDVSLALQPEAAISTSLEPPTEMS